MQSKIPVIVLNSIYSYISHEIWLIRMKDRSDNDSILNLITDIIDYLTYRVVFIDSWTNYLFNKLAKKFKSNK